MPQDWIDTAVEAAKKNLPYFESMTDGNLVLQLPNGVPFGMESYKALEEWSEPLRNQLAKTHHWEVLTPQLLYAMNFQLRLFALSNPFAPILRRYIEPLRIPEKP